MRLLVCLVWLAGLPAVAEAQNAQDFSALHVRVGDRVYVTDERTGVEVNGPIESLTESRLAINGYLFTPGPSLMIERSGDSIWDGAAVGFVVGALFLYPGVPETLMPRGGIVRVNNGLMWGAIGALIDYAHRGRTTVYKGSSPSRPRSAWLLPQIDQRRKAVALALAF